MVLSSPSMALMAFLVLAPTEPSPPTKGGLLITKVAVKVLSLPTKALVRLVSVSSLVPSALASRQTVAVVPFSKPLPVTVMVLPRSPVAALSSICRGIW